jgi:hypothetical protein
MMFVYGFFVGAVFGACCLAWGIYAGAKNDHQRAS